MRACGLWSSRHMPAACTALAPRRATALLGCARRRRPRAARVSARAAAVKTAATTRFAVVGDVHGRWSNAADGAALAALSADFALFVGDIGNEDAGLVREIAALEHPKAVVLGNHDAWHSLTSRTYGSASAKRARVTAAPADELRARALFGNSGGGAVASSSSSGNGNGDGGSGNGDGSSGDGQAAPQGPRSLVQQQLNALGAQHVGYSWLPVPTPAAAAAAAGAAAAQNGNSNSNGNGTDADSAAAVEPAIAVVGGRPFSKGGAGWSSIAAFMRAAYGVDSPDDSAARIAAAADAAAAAGARALVVLAHNGPAGLGGAAHDICGVDFRREAGDHGDPDLRAALDAMAARGAPPAAAVVFGHMHHTLRGGGLRRMARLDAATGTAYLNAATVPRVRNGGAPGETLRHFLVFEVRGGRVEYAADVWVRVSQQQQQEQLEGDSSPLQAEIASETPVLRTEELESGSNGSSGNGNGSGSGNGAPARVRFVWDAHAGRWQREGDESATPAAPPVAPAADEPAAAPTEAAESRAVAQTAAVVAAAATAASPRSNRPNNTPKGGSKPRPRRRR